MSDLTERLRAVLECVEGDDHTWPREKCEREGKCHDIIQAVKRELLRARLEVTHFAISRAGKNPQVLANYAASLERQIREREGK